MSDRIAVMDGGRVVQVGTAQEIYARPATRFVATRSYLGGIVRYWIDVGAPADVHASAGRPPFAGSVFVEVVGRDVHLLPDTDPGDRP